MKGRKEYRNILSKHDERKQNGKKWKQKPFNLIDYPIEST